MFESNKAVSISYINVPEKGESLYDDIDLDYFIKHRQIKRNHKLFTFRDWENIIKKLQLRKVKNLNLTELPSYDVSNLSNSRKQEFEMFEDWLIGLIDENLAMT